MNKPKGEFVMLQGPQMCLNPDGTKELRHHITVVRNDDKLDIRGYEFTEMMGGIESWTWVGRTFRIVSHVDSTTYRPKMYIGLKNSDGTFEELSLTNIYTQDQQNIINATNTALVNKGLPVLTEEEIDCMFWLGKYE